MGQPLLYTTRRSSRYHAYWKGLLLLILCANFVVAFGLGSFGQSDTGGEGTELLGTVAPEFEGLKWIDSPKTLVQLRGQPILIRFWNRNCGMCEATAPLLNDLFARYKDKGLMVIGIHHKKGPKDDTIANVRKTAKDWNLQFPIAIDPQFINTGQQKIGR